MKDRTTERIQVAIVGCGANARRAHVPAWLANRRTTIVALCDPAVEAAERIVQRYRLGASTFRSLDELLSEKRPDVVDICSSTPYHYPLAKQALEAGCHVLVEKPPAPTVKQAQELAEIAERRELKLGVVLNYRYRDLVMQLKQAHDTGLLGQITKFHIVHHGPLVFGDAPWLWDERESKYLFREFGIHYLDILVYLLGPHSEIIQSLPFVQSSIGHTTDFEVTVRFDRGAVGRLEMVADSTRHSSYFTHMYVYGTGMDAFIRWFPPSFRLSSGIVNPLSIIVNEVKAFAQVGGRILAGQFLKQRNISHYRLIDDYVSWVLNEEGFALKMADVLPTLRLLSDIERCVPTYPAVESGAGVVLA